MVMSKERAKEKLLSNIEIVEGLLETPCWIWAGRRNIDGYGIIHVGNGKGATHRVSWELHNGPIPDNLCILHKCDNPPCINPDHLWIGTHRDNIEDCIAKGRRGTCANGGQKGENNPSAKLNEEQVAQIKFLLEEGQLTQAEIGGMFGVSRDAVNNIKLGRKWAHVKSALSVDFPQPPAKTPGFNRRGL